MSDFEARKNAIKTHGAYITTPTGKSMMPFIRGERDNVVIGEPKRPLKPMDVCLFKRQDGVFVLHRLIKVKEDGYVFRGDGCYFRETGIRDDDIVGVMIGYFRNDKYVSASKSKGFRFWSRVWRLSYPIRYALRIPVKLIRKIFR